MVVLKMLTGWHSLCLNWVWASDVMLTLGCQSRAREVETPFILLNHRMKARWSAWCPLQVTEQPSPKKCLQNCHHPLCLHLYCITKYHPQTTSLLIILVYFQPLLTRLLSFWPPDTPCEATPELVAISNSSSWFNASVPFRVLVIHDTTLRLHLGSANEVTLQWKGCYSISWWIYWCWVSNIKIICDKIARY